MDNQCFYIVDSEKLRFPFLGRPLQERRETLSTLLRNFGAEWSSLRVRAQDFLPLVNEIGNAIGVGQELADLTFENSPFDVLPVGSLDEYYPFFGYMTPEIVARYDTLLSSLPQQVVDQFETRDDDGIASRVLYAYRSTFSEAHARNRAVAIDHS
jgi:hypothetical protein